jgi:predicted nucleotidyltransferase
MLPLILSTWKKEHTISMDNKEVLRKLKEYKQTSEHCSNVKKIGVFGSYARGQYTRQSDVDVFIMLKKPRLFDLVKIQKDLQILFGKNVDVVAVTKTMNDYLRKQIQQYGIVV